MTISTWRKKPWTKENGLLGWMKGFVEKEFITGKSLWKIEKKMISTSQKISFFQNCFLLIPIMISTSSEIELTKKVLFQLGRKSVCTSQLRNIEKYVSILWKSCFHLKKSLKNFKNWYPLAGIWFVLKKIDLPLITIIVFTLRKNSE